MKTSITENRELRGWDNHFKTGTLAPLRLLQLQRSELEEAARLLGRGMCDNPANIRAFGIPDAERRSQALARFFGPVLRGLYQRGLIWGAFRDGTLVGVCGMARPGLPAVRTGKAPCGPFGSLRQPGRDPSTGAAMGRRMGATRPQRAALAPGPGSRRLAPPRPRNWRCHVGAVLRTHGQLRRALIPRDGQDRERPFLSEIRFHCGCRGHGARRAQLVHVQAAADGER